MKIQFGKFLISGIWTICVFFSVAAASNELQDEINRALKSGDNEIKLCRSEYRFDSPVVFRNLKNVVIDGNGARLILTRLRSAFLIFGSKRVTFRNFSIDYDPLPYTQGVIMKLDGKRIEFLIDDGYPAADSGNWTWNCHAFTPDGKFWKKYQTDIYAKPTVVNSRTMRLDSRSTLNDLQIGDRIALLKKGESCIDMRECAELTFENITVYTAAGCVFRSYHGESGDRYCNVKIIRGPKPAGANAERLLSSGHDGVHYGYARGGVEIRNCEFAFMGDDSFNHHGSTMVVAAAFAGKKSFHQIIGGRIQDNNALKRLRPGIDKIRMLARDDFRILGEYTFRSYRRLNMTYPKNVRNAFFPTLSEKPEDFQTVFEISVDEPLNFSGEAFFELPSLMTKKFHISDSYFHDHRAYGLRIMASDGIVENCRFERVKGAAIACGPQYAFWREAGWVRNIVIRNNKFKDNGYGYSSPVDARGSYRPGCIVVSAQLTQYDKVFPGNRNIMIENNVIEGSPFAGIFVLGASNVRIIGNKLFNTTGAGFEAGSDLGFSGMAPIWILQSKDVELSENLIIPAVP